MASLKKGNRIRGSLSTRVADVIIYGVIGLIALSTVLPFLYVVAGSFATDKELTERAFFIIPRVWSMNAYNYAIKNGNILMGLWNSIKLTLLGTTVSMTLSLLFAYPLSKKHLRGRTLILNMVIVTMLFSGGMIPTYLVLNGYKLYDSYWALVLIGAISPFNMIIIKNFFQELPVELEEAACIDGCSEIGIFGKIILPLSKPVIASISLFYGVGYWNDYFNAMIYLNTPSKFTVQIILRNIVLKASNISEVMLDYYDTWGAPPDKAVKMAATVIATVPIICIYPFVQKYFTKGVMVGAVKG
ncbi:putative aldouronate transport system permease protein [Anaerotaenia torta]|uniref:carbohydrate ABC transporter permease n=1 Tax=Anaerotaenia torta TaxID=433293 RepID=UPI003D2126F2